MLLSVVVVHLRDARVAGDAEGVVVLQGHLWVGCVATLANDRGWWLVVVVRFVGDSSRSRVPCVVMVQNAYVGKILIKVMWKRMKKFEWKSRFRHLINFKRSEN